MTKSAPARQPRFAPVDALLSDGQPAFPPAPPLFASSSALLELCHEASQILTTLTSMGFASAKRPNICLGRTIDHFVIAAMVARHTALKTVTSLNELTAKVAY
ncbi:hypothetical protein DIPPA_07456 [Diplonema papillatum]|nr:hypothetical protein DIPPA_07456 [Diplonema papillatum]